MPARPLRLGRTRSVDDDPSSPGVDLDLPPHHLVTHAVCVGMTGSGKTGLAIGLVEEALRSRIPVLLIDVKGDLANLGLLFDDLDAKSFVPWVDEGAARRDGKTPAERGEELAKLWRDGLARWGLGPADVRALRESARLRVITPGTTAGEPLNVLSPLEMKSDLWELDEEAARESLGAAISLLLRMVEREADPTRGREHVLLSHLAERRLRSGRTAGLEDLLVDLREPPIERVGALSVDEFLPPKERAALSQDLNALVASPTFATWRQGAPLDVGAWMKSDERTAATIVSVAHLEDEERMLVLSLVLEQTLAWVRGLSGTSDLRALVLFDEVFGFLPPHPSNPPTKRPLLALLKQARAFGVGCVLATQNPIDLDYKALSNAGVWFVGRLQTDADRERVVEGLVGSDGGANLDAADLASVIKSLPPRTFFLRDVHSDAPARLLETRWTLSWLRGPMTRQEIKRWRKERGDASDPPPPIASTASDAASSASNRDAASKAVVSSGATTNASTGAPSVPQGWRSLFPFPPAAPASTWRYAPHAAIVARAEIVDARLGFRESRRIALVVPLDAAVVDVARAIAFNPDDFRHAAVAGAAFAPLPESLLGARATRALERALKDRALAAARATVLSNAALEVVSSPGESAEQFAARCAQIAGARAADEEAAIVRKLDPKLQKLATQRDAARAAAQHAESQIPAGAGVVGAIFGTRRSVDRAEAQRDRAVVRLEKLRDKWRDAEAALAEAVAERNAKIASRRAELAASPTSTSSREIVAKKDALAIEAFAIAWVAS